MKKFSFNESFGYLVSRANAAMRMNFNKAISELGVEATPEQWGLLNAVKQKPGMTQSEIAEVSLKDKTNVTRMLDVLQKNNYIERRNDTSDRRSYKIFLTKDGEKLIKKISNAAIKVNKIAASSFSENEYTQLVNLLNKLYFTMAEKL